MTHSSIKATGIIIGYVRGSNIQYNNLVLVKLNTNNSIVDRFIGRKLIVSDKYGNKYYGKILRRHSHRKPVVEAKFKPNIPGQLIGSECILY